MQTVAEFVNSRYSDDKVVIVGSAGYSGQAMSNKTVHDSVGLFTPELVVARDNDKAVRITDVIPWHVYICHNTTDVMNPIIGCLGEDKSGRLIKKIGLLWVIENAE
jgi:hypothetical protein